MAKRILIADDSLTIQKAFAMTFAAEDVTLLAARSADEGMNVARQGGRPDLVIADAVMPGRSGYDLCAALKTDPSLRGVPVYILTSSHNPYDELRGRQSGADGNFIKPFDSTALIERVGDAIAKGAVASAATAASRAAGLQQPVRAAAPAPAPGAGGMDDDDYGEITIENPGPLEVSRTAPAAGATPALAPAAAGPLRPAMPGAGAGMRPSLIPGLRPGTIPPARPGAVPARSAVGPSAPGPVAAAPASVAAPRAPAPSPPMVGSQTRTVMGMAAFGQQQPAVARSGVTAPPVAPLRPVGPPARSPGPAAAPPGSAAPVMPHAPGPSPGASGVGVNTSLVAAVSSAAASAVDQKIAAYAARGPEYEALAKLSREIIEKVVWEVVPELAELIIREELQKRGRS